MFRKKVGVFIFKKRPCDKIVTFVKLSENGEMHFKYNMFNVEKSKIKPAENYTVVCYLRNIIDSRSIQ